MPKLLVITQDERELLAVAMRTASRYGIMPPSNFFSTGRCKAYS